MVRDHVGANSLASIIRPACRLALLLHSRYCSHSLLATSLAILTRAAIDTIDTPWRFGATVTPQLHVSGGADTTKRTAFMRMGVKPPPFVEMSAYKCSTRTCELSETGTPTLFATQSLHR